MRDSNIEQQNCIICLFLNKKFTMVFLYIGLSLTTESEVGKHQHKTHCCVDSIGHQFYSLSLAGTTLDQEKKSTFPHYPEFSGQ